MIERGEGSPNTLTDRDGMGWDGIGETGFTRDRITVSCLVIWTAATASTARTATQGVWAQSAYVLRVG